MLTRFFVWLYAYVLSARVFNGKPRYQLGTGFPIREFMCRECQREWQRGESYNPCWACDTREHLR